MITAVCNKIAANRQDSTPTPTAVIQSFPMTNSGISANIMVRILPASVAYMTFNERSPAPRHSAAEAVMSTVITPQASG